MLKLEEKEHLADLREHHSFRTLLKVIEDLAQEQERRVTSTQIQVGKEAEVLYAKARAEGARQLQAAFLRLFEKPRSK